VTLPKFLAPLGTPHAVWIESGAASVSIGEYCPAMNARAMFIGSTQGGDSERIRTGTAARYVHEWAAAQAASGYINFDSATAIFDFTRAGAPLNRQLVAKAEAIDSPHRVVLDMDSTEIPVYGEQEQSAYNGHFESTCYHPLLLFNREGDCLAAKLRPGNVSSAEGWEELLLPEIERQQERGKEVVFRADAAFAKPKLYQALEEREVKYAIPLPANDILERDITGLLTRPVGRPSYKPLVRYKSFLYQAASWKTVRRVVAKVEFHFGELFPRVGFIVTNLGTSSRAVVRFYNKRGTAEQWIKEGKQAVKMTRLSCHRFRANEVRLWLSVIAYNLGNLWRRLALPTRVVTWSLTSLQQRLVKTGGRLIKHARYYWLLLAESHLTRRLFAGMLRKIAALPSPAG
jgi:Transposase DDE domain group 1